MRPTHEPHQLALMAACPGLGVRAESMLEAWGLDAVRYHAGGRSVLVFEGCVVPGLSWHTDQLCADKRATKQVLSAAGLSCPEGLTLTPQADLESFLRHVDGPVVCKPMAGTNGEGVAMNLRSVDQVRAHAATLQGQVLVEQQLNGQDLRLHAIGGELVAACAREPAFVQGDGALTVAQLAAAHHLRVQAQNPQNRLDLDSDSHALLSEQGLSLDSVPRSGRRVTLKRVANMAHGAVAVDITDRVHPEYRRWIERAAQALSLDIFALDIITTDPSAAPSVSGGMALEVNARPQWLHHTFSHGRSHDIPTLMLKHLLEL